MTILCLCCEQHHWKLIPGYADAFRRRGIEFFCVDDAGLEEVLRTCPKAPSAIFHFESAQPAFSDRPRALGNSDALFSRRLRIHRVPHSLVGRV